MIDLRALMEYGVRVVPPPPSNYRGRKHDDSAERAARVAAWAEHYETGAGFREAVAEAWRVVVRQRFARWSFQQAAQNVGWTTRRLVWALVTTGRELPEELRSWAERHVAAYERDRATEVADDRR